MNEKYVQAIIDGHPMLRGPLSELFRIGIESIERKFSCKATVVRRGAWIDVQLSRNSVVFVHAREKGYLKTLKRVNRMLGKPPEKERQTELTE